SRTARRPADAATPTGSASPRKTAHRRGRVPCTSKPSARRALVAEALMRVLLVHPGPLMYSELYLRLEPLGLERVAAALLAAGHEVRLLDLQSFTTRDYLAELDDFKP